MREDELELLLRPEVMEEIGRNADEDPAAYAMRNAGRTDIPVRAIAEQIACRKKAAKKLPRLSTRPLLYTSRALEQASAERVAGYRASQMSGQRAIDLSGGLGIDSSFLAGAFARIDFVERDPLLCRLASHTMQVLERKNVAIQCGDAFAVLDSIPSGILDWIFVDPDRRESGRRRVGLSESSPDVVSGHNELIHKAPGVCIKASPALELSGLKRELPSLSSIIVVSLDRQCRESMLILLKGTAQEKEPERKAVCLHSSGIGEYEVSGREGVERRVTAEPGPCFFEPDPAIIKAGLSAEVAEEFGLEFLNHSVDYLTGGPSEAVFPGRAFRLVALTPYKPKLFRRFLKEHQIFGASIQRRDFPLSPEELRRLYRLKESSSRFLFFSRNAAGEATVYFCLSLRPEGEEAP
ncbi:MAG TPA: SAM-dependent methyltransferase [Chlorobium sp.]|uniref:THUMP-like domain-containing protein n=1 Tax=Chlorobium phaeovibrioides (strain DSM 265 / 1930) TaxID=290318 RepID=A4SGV6_CHLPM|nr:SAM-dependent methyltransferase [Chlorobium sp.]